MEHGLSFWRNMCLSSVTGPPWTPPYPLALQALTPPSRQAALLPGQEGRMPAKLVPGAPQGIGGDTRADNLDIPNAAASRYTHSQTASHLSEDMASPRVRHGQRMRLDLYRLD